MRTQGIASIWPDRPPLIGMVHLHPLPGAPAWAGSMQTVVDRAVADARMLDAAGFDGVMVENYGDTPFFAGRLPVETIAALTRAVLSVRGAVPLPVGVNALRNDAVGALAIACATGASFIRVNVHTASMWTDQGLVHGEAARTLRLRESLDADVAILADVHVKHATPPVGSDLGAAAADAWLRGRADALIVSGTHTGGETKEDDIAVIRAAVRAAPILVGSGATFANAQSLLEQADGIIVGSAVMVDGVAGSRVDADRAKQFVTAARR